VCDFIQTAAFIRQIFKTEAWLRSQCCLFDICCGQIDKELGFSVECFGFRLSVSFRHWRRHFFYFHIHAVLIRKNKGAKAVNIQIKQYSSEKWKQWQKKKSSNGRDMV
jgi:hypothetical protein